MLDKGAESQCFKLTSGPLNFPFHTCRSWLRSICRQKRRPRFQHQASASSMRIDKCGQSMYCRCSTEGNRILQNSQGPKWHFGSNVRPISSTPCLPGSTLGAGCRFTDSLGQDLQSVVALSGSHPYHSSPAESRHADRLPPRPNDRRAA